MAQVRRLALTIMDELVDAGVKLLVIACSPPPRYCVTPGTLHCRYGIPVVEVVSPPCNAVISAKQ